MVNGVIMMNPGGIDPQTGKVYGVDLQCGAGNMFVASLESEYSTMLLASPSVGGSLGANYGSVTITNSNWHGNAVAEDGPHKDIVIRYGGNVTLIGNDLGNDHFKSTTRLPLVQISNATIGTNAPGSLISQGNFYRNAVDRVPAIDGSRNDLFPIVSGYHIGRPNSVLSFGDTGGQGGAITKLRQCTGVPFAANTLMMPQAPNTNGAPLPGVTIQATGEIRRSMYTVKVDHIVWKASGQNLELVIGRPPARARIVGIVADTTKAYAGVSGTLQLQVGYTSGGDEYILSHDVKTAPVTKGLVDSDLGSAINRANAVQGGHVQSWTSPGQISVRLISSAGNLGNGVATNLTAGSTTFYVTMELH